MTTGTEEEAEQESKVQQESKKPHKARAKSKKTKKTKLRRPYPVVTINKALTVAQKIKELNGGNPWDTVDVAKAVELGPKTPNFFYLTAASQDFGLTSGTRYTEKIELTPLGREVVYAPDRETEKKKKFEAFCKVDIFKKVLDHYKGSALPEMKYLGNTLEREFKLDPKFHEEFSKLFKQNCADVGIESGGFSETYVGTGIDAGAIPPTVIMGEPKGDQKLKAFIILPFVERNDERPKGFHAEVLRSLLTPAAVAAGFIVETANRQGSDVIQSTIINDLLDADLVIADLTDHNPNVLFELGVRMAVDKPVALIKATGTGKIFDVDNMLRVIEYDSNLWPSTIDRDLPLLRDHIKGAWDNRKSTHTYMKILQKRGDTKDNA